MDVSHTADVANPLAQGLRWWGPSYSDLFGVAYGNPGAAAALRLIPVAGYQVSLLSFQIGAWPNFDRSAVLDILDGVGNVLQSFGTQAISGQVASTFTGPWTSTAGVEIRWGPDAFNTGIDNIVFSVTRVDGGGDPGPSPIPLPASALLLGLGLAGLGVARRRRR